MGRGFKSKSCFSPNKEFWPQSSKGSPYLRNRFSQSSTLQVTFPAHAGKTAGWCYSPLSPWHPWACFSDRRLRFQPLTGETCFTETSIFSKFSLQMSSIYLSFCTFSFSAIIVHTFKRGFRGRLSWVGVGAGRTTNQGKCSQRSFPNHPAK